MLIALLSLLSAPVFADDEVSPNEAGAPALVRAVEGGGVYHPIPVGGSLSYDVVGPVTLEVDLRQRLPTANASIDTVKVAAKGDGMLILTVKVKGGPDSASILDAEGGVPTVADRAEITVPPGEHLFTLEPIDAPYPMLARVVALSDDDSAPVVAVVEEPDTPVVAEPVVEEPIWTEDPVAEVEPVVEEPDEPIWTEDPVAEVEPVVADPDRPVVADTDEPIWTEDLVNDDDPVIEPIEDEPVVVELVDEPVVEEPEPEVPVVELFTDEVEDDEVEDDIEVVDDLHDSFVPEVHEPDLSPPPTTTRAGPSLAAGARIGLGAGAAGNQPSLYLGLEAVIDTPSPAVAVSIRGGRYGVAYAENLPVQPAIGGYEGVAEALDWQTNVRAVEVAGRISPEIELVLGSRPYGQGGVAVYHSTRVSDEGKTHSLGAGTAWAVGLDIPAGAGVFAPELALNTGRQSFDNRTADGADARERVGGVRGNLSYRYNF